MVGMNRAKHSVQALREIRLSQAGNLLTESQYLLNYCWQSYSGKLLLGLSLCIKSPHSGHRSAVKIFGIWLPAHS